MAYKFNSTASKALNRLPVPWFLAVTAPTTLEREGNGGALHAAAADGLNLMERDLLSRVAGDSGRRQRVQGQGQDSRPPPSPTLSLRVGTERRGRAADDTNRGHGHEPQQAQAAAAAASIAAALLPSSSRVHFAPDGRLPSASVVVPGCPMSERRHNLRAAGAGAPRAQASRMPVQEQRQRASPAGPGPAPQRPPMMAPVVGSALELAVAGPTVTAGPERCDACGLSARLLQGLSSDLDRARAQVALLTCQNESLRHRLKRGSASAAPGPECPAVASTSTWTPTPHLNLRCGACRVRPATVLLVPREHLCLCGHCSKSGRDGAAVACPVCRPIFEVKRS